MEAADASDPIFDGSCRLWCLADTDWAHDPETRKSVTCKIVEADGCQVMSGVAQQSLLAQSSGEAAFIGMHEICLDLVFYRNLFSWFGFRVVWRLLTDSSAAKGMAQRQGVGKVRHLDLRTLYLQDLVKTEGLRIVKVKGEHNKADIGTKTHPQAKFEQLRELNQIIPIAELGSRPSSMEANSVTEEKPRKRAFIVGGTNEVRAALVTLLAFLSATIVETKKLNGEASEIVSAPSTIMYPRPCVTCDSYGCAVEVSWATVGILFAMVMVMVHVILHSFRRSHCSLPPQPEVALAHATPRIEIISTRTVGTMSMVTYQRKLQTPRFHVIAEIGQGVFAG